MHVPLQLQMTPVAGRESLLTPVAGRQSLLTHVADSLPQMMVAYHGRT